MPTIQITCVDCGLDSLELVPLSDVGDEEYTCPKCGGKAKKTSSFPTGVRFVGSGFHINDYGTKN